MVKALVDICHVCLAQNLGKINRVGKFLARADKEILLEWLCDHDMFTKERLHFITYQLFSPLLANVTFSYSSQVKDPLLSSLASCASQLRSLTVKSCCHVTGSVQILGSICCVLHSCAILVWVSFEGSDVTYLSLSTGAVHSLYVNIPYGSSSVGF